MSKYKETGNNLALQHLAPPQLARRWGKSIQWVYSNWRRLNVPALKVGQALRFPLDDVIRWEEQNKA